MGEIKNEDIESIAYSISKKIILPKFRNLKKNDLIIKSNNHLVTSVDLAVEKQLKIDLKKLLPSALFIGEELFENNNSIIKYYNHANYCWTVDPIDGTKNFSKGKEKFAIMIALSFKDKILQSWIYKPLEAQLCYALLDEGAFINSKKLFSNNKSNLKNAKGSISTKYWGNNYIYLINSLKSEFESVSNYGCIGYEYIDIANGDRDFAVLSKLSPWDHIPGILIAREAGAFDIYFDRGNYDFQSRKYNLIVASNNILAKNILNFIKGEKL